MMAEISRLPGPVADLWEWQLDGACRTADPRVFFHPEGERGPARRQRDVAAKSVCARCPVLAQCRSHALQVREPYGVWGGLTEDERESIYASGRPGAVPEPQTAAS
ncbi:WhiB family transcriptional regulator [Kineosporia babensis]